MSATVNLPGICGAISRASACTLPAGHAGPHQAQGHGGRLIEEWVEPAVARKQKRRNLVGERFGLLTIVSIAEARRRPGDGKAEQMLLCRCDCGEDKVVYRSNLVSGKTGSCGCLTIEQARTARRAMRQDRVGYTTAHQRVYRDRGPASDHTCECGQSARQWAYTHDDPNELTEARPGRPSLRFSVDPAFYKPMCVSCHIRFDRETAGRPTQWIIRYRHGTDLANRWPEPTESTWTTRAEAEAVRRECFNDGSMEIVEIPLMAAEAVA